MIQQCQQEEGGSGYEGMEGTHKRKGNEEVGKTEGETEGARIYMLCHQYGERGEGVESGGKKGLGGEGK